MKKLLSGSGLLALAVVLGLVTAAAALTWLTRTGREQAERAAAIERTRQVVVAKADLPAGSRLAAAMVELRAVPEAAILPGTSSEVNAIVGKVLRYPLIAGEQVTTRKLVSEETAGTKGLAFAVPDGMRAVAIPITEVHGAGGMVVPGDRVDVLVHTDYARMFAPSDARAVDRQDQRQPTVLTLLQDLLVVAVAQHTTPPADGANDPAARRPENAEAQPAAKSVTLAVTPSQAQSLFFAAEEGQIGLALRSFGDDNVVTLGPQLRLEPLGTQVSTALPPAPPPPAPVR